jgi:eukaryotic-like serine/threonine-protein kinase
LSLIDAGFGLPQVGMDVLGSWPTGPSDLEAGGQPPAAGIRLGRYRLIEPIGRGSQGEVWKALQVEPLVEEVALKLLAPDRSAHPARFSQFRREAEWGARLEGPSLLPTYEFGMVAGFAFLAMPLVDGGSLADVLARRRLWLSGAQPPVRHRLDRLPRAAFLREVVTIGARVSRALAAAHSSRIVHRDVKPANILVDRLRRDGVYLADFGLGRDLSDRSPAPLCGSIGTPLYMAPEKLLGRSSDEVLCDVYALGVTLFESVTLVRPFSVPADLPRARWSEYLAFIRPCRPREVAAWVPNSLDAIIRRAMSRNPDHRHPSMQSFADELEAEAFVEYESS